jgi:hypothetical protein
MYLIITNQKLNQKIPVPELGGSPQAVADSAAVGGERQFLGRRRSDPPMG